MAKAKSKGDTAKKKSKSRKAVPDAVLTVKASSGKGAAGKAPTDKAPKALKAAKPGGKKANRSVTKTFAGVKLPKALRKLGPVRDMLTSDLGREILADALVAAAGAAAMALTKARGGSDVKTVAKAAAQGVIHSAAGTVAGVVGEAARHFLPPGLLSDAGGAASNGPTPLPAPQPAARSGAKAGPRSSTRRTAGKAGSGRGATKRSPAAPGPAAVPEPDRSETSGEASSQE